MRKFLAALALMGLCASASVAYGQVEWVTKEVKWAITNQGGPSGATAIWHRDTTFNVVAGGQTDTTHQFSLEHLALPLRIAATTTAADTLLLGYLLFAPDSLGVSAPTISSITVELDGGVQGADGNTALSGWAQIDSSVALGLSTRGVVQVPIKAIGNLGNPAITIHPYAREYNTLAFPVFRARVTAATGVMSACRVFVRYPKNISGAGSRSQ